MTLAHPLCLLVTSLRGTLTYASIDPLTANLNKQDYAIMMTRAPHTLILHRCHAPIAPRCAMMRAHLHHDAPITSGMPRFTAQDNNVHSPTWRGTPVNASAAMRALVRARRQITPASGTSVAQPEISLQHASSGAPPAGNPVFRES